MALWLMPVGLEAAYEEGTFTLTARPIPVKLLPRERVKKLERQGEREAEHLWQRLPKPILRLLAENGGRALKGLWPYVAVKKLRLHIVTGGPDPYGAVMAYGRAGALLEALAAWYVGADLSVRADMTGGPPKYEGRVRVQTRFGNLVGAAASFGAGFLRGYFLYRHDAGRE